MLSDLVSSGNNNAALKYLSDMGAFMDNTEEFVSSGNERIDSILNYVIGKAQNANIHISWKIQIPEQIEISTFDIQIQSGLFGVPGLLEIPVPDLLYDIKILTPFGFPYKGFHSSDYFPLFPWIFLYLCGFYFNQIFMKHISWQKYARCKIPCLSAIGSRTIWIYLLHQPLSMLICFLTFH